MAAGSEKENEALLVLSTFEKAPRLVFAGEAGGAMDAVLRLLNESPNELRLVLEVLTPASKPLNGSLSLPSPSITVPAQTSVALRLVWHPADRPAELRSSLKVCVDGSKTRWSVPLLGNAAPAPKKKSRKPSVRARSVSAGRAPLPTPFGRQRPLKPTQPQTARPDLPTGPLPDHAASAPRQPRQPKRFDGPQPFRPPDATFVKPPDATFVVRQGLQAEPEEVPVDFDQTAAGASVLHSTLLQPEQQHYDPLRDDSLQLSAIVRSGRVRRPQTLLDPRDAADETLDPVVRALTPDFLKEADLEHTVVEDHEDECQDQGVVEAKSMVLEGEVSYVVRSRREKPEEQKERAEAYAEWLNAALRPKVLEEEGQDALPTREETVAILASALRSTHLQTPTAQTPATAAAASHVLYADPEQLERLLRKARALIQAQPLVDVLPKVREWIAKGQLAVTADIHGDLGSRQELLHLFLSVTPLWLRLGLTVVFEEPLKTSPGHFVAQRLLTDPDICLRYSRKRAISKEGSEALGKHFLNHALPLVLFLDVAKRARLVTHDPRLFRPGAGPKSTQELLLGLCRWALGSDHSVVRLLKRAGFSPAVIQRPIDEVDFAVRDLVRDVRDGVRLSRLVELLTERRDLIPSLVYHGEKMTDQVAAVCNLNRLFGALEDTGLVLHDLNPRDIVDCKAPVTLELIRRIVDHFNHRHRVFLCDQQVTFRGSPSPTQAVSRPKAPPTSPQPKSSHSPVTPSRTFVLQRSDSSPHIAVGMVGLRSGKEMTTEQSVCRPKAPPSSLQPKSSQPPVNPGRTFVIQRSDSSSLMSVGMVGGAEMTTELTQHLASSFETPLTPVSSLAIPSPAKSEKSAQSDSSTATDVTVFHQTPEQSPVPVSSPVASNEDPTSSPKTSLQISAGSAEPSAGEALSEEIKSGQNKDTAPVASSEHTGESPVPSLGATLSDEDGAGQKDLDKAATLIQKTWRGWRARRRLRVLIREIIRCQKYWRGHNARLKYAKIKHAKRKSDEAVKRLESITKIQCVWRVVLAKEKLKKLRKAKEGRDQAVVRLQSHFRGMAARMLLAKLRESKRHEEERLKAVLRLQCVWRGVLARRKLALLDQQKKERMAAEAGASVKIQTAFRGWVARRRVSFLKTKREAEKTTEAAVTIQSWWRMQMALRRRRSLFRAKMCEEEEKCEEREKEEAARKIQRGWRRTLERLRQAQIYETRSTEAAIKIQAFYRGVLDRRRLEHQRQHELRLTPAQSTGARTQAPRLEKTQNRAAIKIQRSWRRHMVFRVRELQEAEAKVQATASPGPNGSMPGAFDSPLKISYRGNISQVYIRMSPSRRLSAHYHKSPRISAAASTEKTAAEVEEGPSGAERAKAEAEKKALEMLIRAQAYTRGFLFRASLGQRRKEEEEEELLETEKATSVHEETSTSPQASTRPSSRRQSRRLSADFKAVQKWFQDYHIMIALNVARTKLQMARLGCLKLEEAGTKTLPRVSPAPMEVLPETPEPDVASLGAVVEAPDKSAAKANERLEEDEPREQSGARVSHEDGDSADDVSEEGDEDEESMREGEHEVMALLQAQMRGFFVRRRAKELWGLDVLGARRGRAVLVLQSHWRRVLAFRRVKTLAQQASQLAQGSRGGAQRQRPGLRRQPSRPQLPTDPEAPTAPKPETVQTKMRRSISFISAGGDLGRLQVEVETILRMVKVNREATLLMVAEPAFVRSLYGILEESNGSWPYTLISGVIVEVLLHLALWEGTVEFVAPSAGHVSLLLRQLRRLSRVPQQEKKTTEPILCGLVLLLRCLSSREELWAEVAGTVVEGSEEGRCVRGLWDQLRLQRDKARKVRELGARRVAVAASDARAEVELSAADERRLARQTERALGGLPLPRFAQTLPRVLRRPTLHHLATSFFPLFPNLHATLSP